jgi:hypothetical protein
MNIHLVKNVTLQDPINTLLYTHDTTMTLGCHIHDV